MTAKRDLKRRVRQRQARTGESYVTALRRVLAARSETPEPGQDEAADLELGEQTQPGETAEPADRTELGERTQPGEAAPATAKDSVGLTEPAMSVVELHEVTREARLLGFRCRITMFPSVLEACELANVLSGLRDALVGVAGGTAAARLFDAAFGIRSRPLVALVAEPYPPVSTLTFSAPGRAGRVEIVCRLWYPAPTLILLRADEAEREALVGRLGAFPSRFEREARVHAEVLLPRAMLHVLEPMLFVIHGERRYPVTRHAFVIGRDRKAADLAIRDGRISRKHAVVLFRDGVYYLKDLGSTNGIHYKGMRIDNKRIDEGDVFQIGDHELRFTYQVDG